MARPVKKRNVCNLPSTDGFGPLNSRGSSENLIIMSIDEYETIRLIDYEGLTQQECSDQMEVARTTVQGIYSSARKKLAEALVLGSRLQIEGGHYKLCDGQGPRCRKGRCKRARQNNRGG